MTNLSLHENPLEFPSKVRSVINSIIVKSASIPLGQYSGNKLVSANWTDIIADYVSHANKIIHEICVPYKINAHCYILLLG